jgi:hypothetical protein
VSYFILGGLFCLIGTVCMIKRQRKDRV